MKIVTPSFFFALLMCMVAALLSFAGESPPDEDRATTTQVLDEQTAVGQATAEVHAVGVRSPDYEARASD